MSKPDPQPGNSGNSDRIDAMSAQDAAAALERCCGASRWVAGMLARRPFGTDSALLEAADAVWAQARRADILEAFDHHPRIGADMDALRTKFASTAAMALGEQAGAAAASEAQLEALRDGNLAYEARYGHIFIICASGKSAAEMLASLRARMPNTPERELEIAAAEQAKITRLRLERLS